MTEKRKKLQDKLRRKFGYHTDTNYGRGIVLAKANAGESCACVKADGSRYQDFRDLNIVMHKNTLGLPPITVYTTEFRDYGEGKPLNERYVKRSEHQIQLTLEELDLIHAIAHEMAEENDWAGQTKRHKKRHKK